MASWQNNEETRGAWDTRSTLDQIVLINLVLRTHRDIWVMARRGTPGHASLGNCPNVEEKEEAEGPRVSSAGCLHWNVLTTLQRKSSSRTGLKPRPSGYSLIACGKNLMLKSIGRKSTWRMGLDPRYEAS